MGVQIKLENQTLFSWIFATALKESKLIDGIVTLSCPNKLKIVQISLRLKIKKLNLL